MLKGMVQNMNLAEKKFLVAGLGKSGIGAANLLLKTGADVTLYDSNEKLTLEDIKDKLIRNEGVSLVTGELSEQVIQNTDIMVLSPGIAIDAPFVNEVRAHQIPIWGEVELAYVCAKGRIAGITGTNGKTTTTALVGEIFANYYQSSFVVGNIGIPYTSVALDTKEDSVTVAEISSFQLETVNTFHPCVSAILNITPDHLNRHYTMDNYANVKFKITMNQDESDVCVLNYEDDIIKEKAKDVKAKILWFSSARKLQNGIYLKDGDIILAENGKEQVLMNVSQMQLVGIHNAENVMAAIGIAKSMGVSMDIILDTVKHFKAVEHRIEYVKTVNGVMYYNDSKGTNTDASIKAIEAMSKPTVLIAGGYDKGSEYDEWFDAFQGKIKALVLLGKTKDKIAQTAKRKNYQAVYEVNTLEEAVKEAAKLAKDGEVVLLSPACASWDMFKSYEERGRLFKEYVRNL